MKVLGASVVCTDGLAHPLSPATVTGPSRLPLRTAYGRTRRPTATASGIIRAPLRGAPLDKTRCFRHADRGPDSHEMAVTRESHIDAVMIGPQLSAKAAG